MAQLMLVNPRRKRRTTRKRNARGEFTNPRRKRTHHRRRRAHHTRRKHPYTWTENPRPRRRRSHHRRRTSHRRRYHRNPRSSRGFLSKAFFRDTLIPSAIGGAGAVAVDVMWAMAPVPANIKSGAFAPVVKVGGAIVLGWAVSRFASKRIGEGIVSGYLTVTAASMIKTFLQHNVPSLPLSEYPYMGFVNAGQTIPDNGMGVYLTDQSAPVAAPDQSMGEYVEGYQTEGYF